MRNSQKQKRRQFVRASGRYLILIALGTTVWQLARRCRVSLRSGRCSVCPAFSACPLAAKAAKRKEPSR